MQTRRQDGKKAIRRHIMGAENNADNVLSVTCKQHVFAGGDCLYGYNSIRNAADIYGAHIRGF